MVDCYRLVGGRVRAMVPSSTTRAGSTESAAAESPEHSRPRAGALRTRTPLVAAARPMRAPEGSTQSPEPGHRCLPEVGGLGRCVRIVGERRSLVKNHVQPPRIHAPAGPRGRGGGGATCSRVGGHGERSPRRSLPSSGPKGFVGWSVSPAHASPALASVLVRVQARVVGLALDPKTEAGDRGGRDAGVHDGVVVWAAFHCSPGRPTGMGPLERRNGYRVDSTFTPGLTQRTRFGRAGRWRFEPRFLAHRRLRPRHGPCSVDLLIRPTLAEVASKNDRDRNRAARARRRAGTFP